MESEQPDLKIDERGMLYEAFRLGDSQVFVITLEPNSVRGNHFHRRKIEKFIAVAGSCEIVSRNRDTEEVTRLQVNGSEPQIVTVSPDNTHKITTADKPCTLICWVSEIFDIGDTDTVAEDV